MRYVGRLLWGLFKEKSERSRRTYTQLRLNFRRSNAKKFMSFSSASFERSSCGKAESMISRNKPKNMQGIPALLQRRRIKEQVLKKQKDIALRYTFFRQGDTQRSPYDDVAESLGSMHRKVGAAFIETRQST